ncbi:MAG: (2Fe-2S)-binding protein [Clostridiales bacterium]|jgi:bacterioferritin-associated ferredoxin|nr:(2Fe-2S)-binding protein [Clostridiales bacterium]
MDMRKKGDDFMVCLCKKKTKKEVMDLIREKEIKTLDELREIGDVGNKCGACAEDLEQLLTMAYE